MKIFILFAALFSMGAIAHAADEDKKNSVQCEKSLSSNKPKKIEKIKNFFFSDFESQKEKIRKEIKAIVADEKDPRSKIIMDVLIADYVIAKKIAPESFWTISWMVGNPNVQYTQKEIEDIEAVAKKIHELGYLIIHDANSTAAPHIARAVGEFSLAIGTSSTSKEIRNKLKNFVVIDDPYKRLMAFSKADHVTFSPDSLAGLAVLVNSGMTSHLPVARSEFTSSLSGWRPDFSEPSLGFPYYSTPSKIDLVERPTIKAPPKEFSLDRVLSNMMLMDLEKLVKVADENVEGREKFKTETKGVMGALVVGSGNMPGPHVQTVYQVVKVLASWGVPITTGGSGGVMEIANTAAYDAGAPSVGIPIVGSFSIKTEKSVANAVHTLTLPVSGYTSRIPLLIDGKKLIVVAPGGSGTVKELATLLMAQNAQLDPEIVYMFIGKKYYGSLVEGLRKYLPASLVKNFLVVDSAEEAVNELNKLSETVWKNLNYAVVRTSEKVKPRNGKNSFSMPPPIFFSDFDDGKED